MLLLAPAATVGLSFAPLLQALCCQHHPILASFRWRWAWVPAAGAGAVQVHAGLPGAGSSWDVFFNLFYFLVEGLGSLQLSLIIMQPN